MDNTNLTAFNKVTQQYDSGRFEVPNNVPKVFSCVLQWSLSSYESSRIGVALSVNTRERTVTVYMIKDYEGRLMGSNRRNYTI